jgi:hypothetical protein
MYFSTFEIDLISTLKLYLRYMGVIKVIFISFPFDLFRVLKNTYISYEFVFYL